MEKSIKDAIIEIARCEGKECCEKIRGTQTSEVFQLPDPFNGKIDIAKIMVISSNPSIDETLEELYPTDDWSDDEIVDFFYNRFEKYVKSSEVLNKNREFSKKKVTYWSHINNRVKEIFKLADKNEIIPGEDYCITEVVHCKSKGEEGVTEAVKTCSAAYLKKVVKLSHAKVLVIVGSVAKKTFCEQYNLMKYIDCSLISEPENIEEIERLIYFMPAPNAWCKKILDKRFADYPDELNRFKEWMQKDYQINLK